MSARYALLKRLVPYLKPHWHTLAIGTVLALGVSAAEGAIAWLVKPAMDGIFLRRDVTTLKLITLPWQYLLKGVGRPGWSTWWARWASA
jgi:subfamily B ATP-binding cassette protein MsbA